MNTTQILLTSKERWPKCGASGHAALMGIGPWAVWRGKPIVIELPPEPPGRVFECDTPIVWRVSTDWMRSVGVKPPATGYVCVCVHQVQAD